MLRVSAAVTPTLFDDGIARGAILAGPPGQEPIYRYALWRTWDATRGVVLWVMFNPSTADHLIDDPTIRRCVGFTKAWGAGGLVVVNLYGLRATEPWRVLDHPDPVGPQNDQTIAEQIAAATRLVAAWGAVIGPYHGARVRRVEALAAAAGLTLECLGQTFHGRPRHPLYVKGTTPLVPYRTREH